MTSTGDPFHLLTTALLGLVRALAPAATAQARIGKHRWPRFADHCLTPVAGDRDVDVFSPRIGQQLLRAFHIDELRLHVAPVLLGAGTRLFENLGDEAVQLEMLETKMGPKATHLRYAISRGASPR